MTAQKENDFMKYAHKTPTAKRVFPRMRMILSARSSLLATSAAEVAFGIFLLAVPSYAQEMMNCPRTLYGIAGS